MKASITWDQTESAGVLQLRLWKLQDMYID